MPERISLSPESTLAVTGTGMGADFSMEREPGRHRKYYTSLKTREIQTTITASWLLKYLPYLAIYNADLLY